MVSQRRNMKQLFKKYVQFVILSCEFVGECYWIRIVHGMFGTTGGDFMRKGKVHFFIQRAVRVAIPVLEISPTRCTILLSIFISHLYIFRATMYPSSGEITVSMRHWYLSLCMGGIWSAGWSFNPTSRPDPTHTEWQIPVSHRYSNFPWWWAHSCLKHAEKRNEYTEQKCALSWIYLQDCTRMHGQQDIKIGYSGCIFSDLEQTFSSYSAHSGSLLSDLLRVLNVCTV